jgi:hypothetical protein
VTVPLEKENKMNDEKEMKDFYAEIVESLKTEATGLKNKLSRCSNDNNFNMYVQLVKALRETMELIKRYEWQLMYSEFKISCHNSDKGFIKQVSVWEQNCECEIRNDKKLTVIDEKENK